MGCGPSCTSELEIAARAAPAPERAPETAPPKPLCVDEDELDEQMVQHDSSRVEKGKHVSRQAVFAGSQDGRSTKLLRSKKPDANAALVRNAVQQNTLLGAMLSTQLAELIEYMTESNLKPGHEVDLSGGMAIIISGKIRVKGSGMHSITFSSGDVVGDTGLLHSRFNDDELSHARAMETTKVYILKRQVFVEVMAYHRQKLIHTNLQLLSSIPIFNNLSVPEKLKLADASTVEIFLPGAQIVKEGEVGEHFYIIKSGEAEVLRKQKDGSQATIDWKYKGDYFGEEALITGLPRNATIVAAPTSQKRTEALRVDKGTFLQLLGPICEILDRSEGAVRTLDIFAVPLLAELTAESREELIKRLQEVVAHSSSQDILPSTTMHGLPRADIKLAGTTFIQFKPGATIFSQGEIGDKLFIIKQGEVSIQVQENPASRSQTPGVHGREIDHLYRGQYFGERALLKQEPRMASAVACGDLICYTLLKRDFDEMALKKKAFWNLRWEMEDTRDPTNLSVLGTLGAFGTAYYVQHRKFPDRGVLEPSRCFDAQKFDQHPLWPQIDVGYALKVLEKRKVRDSRFRSVVTREKTILAGLPPHPNVIALYQTFQDEDRLFMLMEIATGGELYKLLKKQHRFSTTAAGFFAACVVLALEHLHSHNTIYRDLKPENLLLTSNGYLKLIDMGFAKKIVPGVKTYTLCGTPYYLAPEMIKHSGHDKALDWWTVGVLIFEMLEGEPPFLGDTEMEVYSRITKLEYIFPSHFPPSACKIISKLLSPSADKRLGNLRNGAADVQAEPFFDNIDFLKLLNGTIPPPFVPPAMTPPGLNDQKRKVNEKAHLGLSKVLTRPGAKTYWPGW